MDEKVVSGIYAHMGNSLSGSIKKHEVSGLHFSGSDPCGPGIKA
jgi:hypothetical protein